jgi:integrase
VSDPKNAPVSQTGPIPPPSTVSRPSSGAAAARIHLRRLRAGVRPFPEGTHQALADEEGKIKRHLLPAWGSLPLKAITRTQVAELLDTVASKGLKSGTNRIQAVISRMFTVALNRGLIEAHPAARLIKRLTEQARDRVLTDEEIRALWTGLDAQPGAASDAVRLRLLLGQRGQETAGMF